MYRTSKSSLVYQADREGVEALDPLTGKRVWGWSTGNPRTYGRAQIVVDGDLVLFVADYADLDAPPPGLFGVPALFKGVVALDAMTGALRWQTKLPKNRSEWQGQVQLVVTGDVVVVQLPASMTMGFAGADGRTLWHNPSARDLLAVEGHTTMPDYVGTA